MRLQDIELFSTCAAKTGAQRTKRLSAVSGEDTEMCEDEAAEGAATDPSEKETDAGWSLSEVDEHVLMTSTGVSCLLVLMQSASCVSRCTFSGLSE